MKRCIRISSVVLILMVMILMGCGGQKQKPPRKNFRITISRAPFGGFTKHMVFEAAGYAYAGDTDYRMRIDCPCAIQTDIFTPLQIEIGSVMLDFPTGYSQVEVETPKGERESFRVGRN